MGAVPWVRFEFLGQVLCFFLLTVVQKGPVLVSPKVITDPQTLSIKAIYNGTTVQDGKTS